VTIDERPYLIFADEHGAGAPRRIAMRGGSAHVPWGLPPNGFPRITDISDETHPKTISKIMLEIDDRQTVR